MNNKLLDSIHTVHDRIFGFSPEKTVRAPGRANIIGEHTDYNGGFVLPVGIDKNIYACGSKRKDNNVELHSLDFKSSICFSLDELVHNAEHRWADYQKGVISELIKAGQKPGGFNMVFGGDIPIGAGLSSSAAVELAAALLIDRLFNLGLDELFLIDLCQKAERNFVGVQCGIMDQFSSCMAKKDMAILLDCRTNEHIYCPFEMKEHRFVLCNTLKKRSLVDSEYNLRRKECETGVEYFNGIKSSIHFLRDISPELFNKFREKLPDNIKKRCEHVVFENERVLECVRALEQKNIIGAGGLLYESHDSLRDLYEVSCSELDIMVEIAKTIDGNMGSRMMGAGFGGCTINIVESGKVDDFCKIINEEYTEKTGIKPEIYITKIEDGASEI